MNSIKVKTLQKPFSWYEQCATCWRLFCPFIYTMCLRWVRCLSLWSHALQTLASPSLYKALESQWSHSGISFLWCAIHDKINKKKKFKLICKIYCLLIFSWESKLQCVAWEGGQKQNWCKWWALYALHLPLKTNNLHYVASDREACSTVDPRGHYLSTQHCLAEALEWPLQPKSFPNIKNEFGRGTFWVSLGLKLTAGGYKAGRSVSLGPQPELPPTANCCDPPAVLIITSNVVS